MATEQPNYQIRNFSESTFNRAQLMQILDVLPITANVTKGHDLPLESRTWYAERDTTLMVDYPGAQLIELRPPEGMRLVSASMSGPLAQKFTPSRIMDEATGGGACSSYHANTRELGLDFDVDFGIDVYKLG
tara:strand:- start:382 stop:777 length:396 start_codon:yes stop_codon:yes gene_type:complete